MSICSNMLMGVKSSLKEDKFFSIFQFLYNSTVARPQKMCYPDAGKVTKGGRDSAAGARAPSPHASYLLSE